MSSSWEGGSTTRWRRIRAQILARDRYMCRIAFPGTWTTRTGEVRRCLGRADCVHHTKGRTVTGDDPEHMIAACTPCNLRVGDPRKHHEPSITRHSKW